MLNHFKQKENDVFMNKLLYILAILSISVILLDGTNVIADGANDDLTASVSIGSSAPTVGAISCVGGETFTLNSETIKLVNCSATITDLNGYQDINSVRGAFYSSAGEGDAADTRDNYKNATCVFTDAGTGTTRDAECSFTVYFHANPTSWTVYMNATDDGDDTGTNTVAATVNTLVALNVTETEINFGEVALDGISSEITTNIKNTGNVDIDLNINETLYNGYMNCTDVASDDIQTDAASTGIRFNITSGFTFADTVWNVTATNALADVSWVEADQNGAPTAPTTPLYWLIKLPADGLTGSCSTTIRIAAAESS